MVARVVWDDLARVRISAPRRDMKAVYFSKPGGLNVLTYGEAPKPRPSQGEVLIRVRASGLNHLDIWLREDKDNARGIKLPHIPGSDVAGIIEEVKGAGSLKAGQEVIINPAIPCGNCSRCKKGHSCELVSIFGIKNQGGYAEYITAPIDQIYPKPKNISFVEAAAFPLTFLTAWHMLVGRVDLQPGETVFIWGASGGLGSSAIQIARYLGARVIAAVKSSKEAEIIKKIGAQETVIYTRGDVTRAVKKKTLGLGVDVVFESVGQKTWNSSLAMLRPYGRLVIAGTTSGDMGTQDLSDIYVRQLTIYGARMGTTEEFEKMLKVVRAGKLKPVIDQVFKLSDAAKAQQRMAEGKQVGKIVLEVS